MSSSVSPLPVGACPVCGLQYTGRVHICPGPITHDLISTLIGSQVLEEDLPRPRRRPRYGDRLGMGFRMMSDRDRDAAAVEDPVSSRTHCIS